MLYGTFIAKAVNFVPDPIAYRPAWYRKDTLRTGRSESNRSHVHPSHRIRVGAKVRRRGCAYGPVAVCKCIVGTCAASGEPDTGLQEMARSKKACIIFFDEVDSFVSSVYAHVRSRLTPVQGGARFDDGAGGDNEVQRTMLELIVQLDGFDNRGNIK